MKISILCEGRLNKCIENDLCKLYLDRILSLKNSGILNIEIKKISEKKEINKNKNIKNIILDENGENLTTLSLSKKISELNNQRVEFLNFYIGNPDGFKNSVDKFEKLSLGKMTFPHSLARVILCEQIYRCATLLTNHPYHKS